MKSRHRLILSAAFGALIVLILFLGLGAIRRARSIHDEMITAHQSYLETEYLLREIPADLYLGGVLIRDYLLDLSHIRGEWYRARVMTVRERVQNRLDVLETRLGKEETQVLKRLRNEVEAYWASLDPVFEWTPQQKAVLGYVFLRRNVLQHRNTVVALAEQIEKFNTGNLGRERLRLEQTQKRLEEFLWRMMWISVVVGAGIAVVSIVRVSTLEKRDAQQRENLEQAEEELRKLSRGLVQALEDERRSLSRELHDAVGQMLTALRMDLANLERFRLSPEKFSESLEDARKLNTETMRSVRDLAMGLRPAMLDDLGLGPALEWQGREFSRRGGIPVTVQVDGTLESLPEPYRTGIFRVVQEALTNCARHAHAKSIRVVVHGSEDWVHVTVQDDGIGFEAGDGTVQGLGLLGIEERIRELGGVVHILSEPRKGTLLKVDVPVKHESLV